MLNLNQGPSRVALILWAIELDTKGPRIVICGEILFKKVNLMMSVGMPQEGSMGSKLICCIKRIDA